MVGAFVVPIAGAATVLSTRSVMQRGLTFEASQLSAWTRER